MNCEQMLIGTSITKRALAIGAGVTLAWFLILLLVAHLSFDEATVITVFGIIPTWLALAHSAKIAASFEVTTALDAERNKQLQAQTTAQESIAKRLTAPTKAEIKAEKLLEHKKHNRHCTMANPDNTTWGSSTALIGEVKDGIVTFFVPYNNGSQSFSRQAECEAVDVDEREVHLRNILIIKVNAWHSVPRNHGEAKTWEEAVGGKQ